ncbi:DUF5685 family protein [Qiania dongpingensis]|nr:DUF5685 family protein [Qiania dongpingensis]
MEQLDDDTREGVHMFGYVTINKPELKIKDFKRYQGYYCGLCRSLRMRYGFTGQLALNYDMVFLAALLTGLYEGGEFLSMRRCALHPTAKHMSIQNPYIDYAADMTVLLTYHNLLDDWMDDRNVGCLAAARILRKDCASLREKYPRQWNSMVEYLKKLHAYEEKKGKSLDTAARFTGEMLGELLVFKEDEWAASLRRIGFYLGKFIYLMDAYEDLEEDEKKDRYNPLREMKEKEEFDVWCGQVLTMMMAECSREFERLPILKDIDILRNILYAGVWTKYDIIKKKRAERTGE